MIVLGSQNSSPISTVPIGFRLPIQCLPIHHPVLYPIDPIRALGRWNPIFVQSWSITNRFSTKCVKVHPMWFRCMRLSYRLYLQFFLQNHPGKLSSRLLKFPTRFHEGFLCVYPCLHPDNLWSPVTLQVIIIPWAGLLVVRFTLKSFSRLHGFRFQIPTLAYFRALILVFHTFSRWFFRSFRFRSWCSTVTFISSAWIMLFSIRFQPHPTSYFKMIISHSFGGQKFSSKSPIKDNIL